MRSRRIVVKLAVLRRVLLTCLTVVGVLALTTPDVSYAEPNGCKLQSSWLGFFPNEPDNRWMSTADGQSANFGTIKLELPAFDMTLSGNFPTAKKKPLTLRGVWKRTSGNTFAYTLIGFAIDENGRTVWIGKNSGYDTLTEHCNKLTVVSTLEVFLPHQNPFADAAILAVPIPVHTAYRMRVDPPFPF